MKRQTLTHEFVEYIPDELKEGTLYISMSYATVAHKCCCGCGQEVVTPLSPTDWTLIFDGKSITLDPSIGNWSFACRSHYWICRGRVQWAGAWTQEEINAGRARNRAEKKRFFGAEDTKPLATQVERKPWLWRKLKCGKWRD